MKRSDVFDNFVKIAHEKGLISEGEHAEHTEKTEKNPRWDSLDLSAIEALYGVKPDIPKGMEYEHNIIEDAHPNAAVVSPSYDKLNGLFESNIERQNIIMHIVDKTPSGLLTQCKYAEKELLMALVRVANDMDNKDKDELRVLADTCLGQLHSRGSLQKAGFVPALIGIATLIGALYAQQHLADFDQGIRDNYKNLQKQISDLLTDSAGWLTGHQYDPAIKEDLSGFSDRLNRFMDLYNEAEPTIRSLEKPKDSQELMQLAQHPQTPDVMKAYETLRTAVEQMDPYLDQIQQNFGSDFYKARHTQDKGWWTGIYEKLPSAMRPTSDDFEDVVNALIPFRSSIKQLLELLKNSKSVEQKAHADLAAATAKSQEDLGSTPSQKTEQPAPTAQTPSTRGIPDIEEEVAGLNKMLEGIPGIP